MKTSVSFQSLDGSSLKIGVIKSRWNQEVVEALCARARAGLLDAGVREEHIVEISVPGSYELPFAADRLAEQGEVDAMIVLGCLIKGETMHFEYICESISHGLMRVQLDRAVPIVFGVLMSLNHRQAHVRSIGEQSVAYEWGLTAVEMGIKKYR